MTATALPSVGDPGEGVRVGAAAAGGAVVEGVDAADLLGRELEVEELEVLPDPCRGDGLGEDDVAALNVPTQHDLRGRPADAVGDGGDHGVVEYGALRDRRPCLGDNAVR